MCLAILKFWIKSQNVEPIHILKKNCLKAFSSEGINIVEQYVDHDSKHIHTWFLGVRASFHIHGYPRLVSTQRGPQYLPLPGQNLTRPLGYIKQVREPQVDGAKWIESKKNGEAK